MATLFYLITRDYLDESYARSAVCDALLIHGVEYRYLYATICPRMCGATAELAIAYGVAIAIRFGSGELYKVEWDEYGLTIFSRRNAPLITNYQWNDGKYESKVAISVESIRKDQQSTEDLLRIMFPILAELLLHDLD